MPRAVGSNRTASVRRDLLPRACIAVDWSGSLSDERSRIWLAESRRRRVVRLECGLRRAEVVRELIRSAEREPRLVVGLDFAFSFPYWFAREHGCANGRDVWELVAREGENWLADCPPPFWGKFAVQKPQLGEGRSEWRATESDTVAVSGIQPKPIFLISGAGSVGTGSLRGMPYLRQLQDAGFAIWPFDRPRLPMAVEIYPRYLTGPVAKANPIARALYLSAHHAHEDAAILALAASSDDAFDAAVSAARMQRFARDFGRLGRRRRTRLDRIEGRIWKPVRDPIFERW
jgi:hypothetical protein